MARRSNTISIRLSLDQADKLKNELKALGTAGEHALDKIRKAAVKANLAKFRDSVNKLKADLATVGRRSALAFGALATATAGAATAFYKLAKSSSEVIDEQGKAAQQVGLTIRQFGRLAFAFEQGGVSQDQFITGMRQFQRAIVQANDGMKQYQRAFDRLGIKITDAFGKLRPTRDILNDVADAFAKLPDGALKTASSMDLFSRSGALMIPTLNQGSKALKSAGDQAEVLGIVFTRSQFKIAEALNDTVNELKRAAGGIKNQIGVLFAPELTKGAAALRDALISNKDAIIAWARSVRDRAVVAARDLYYALSGQDSKVSNKWILDLRDGILQFGKDVKYVVVDVVVPLFKGLSAAADVVAGAINKIFGTNITGGQVLLTVAALQLLGVFSALASAATVVVAGINLIGSALTAAFGGEILAGIAAAWAGIVEAVTVAAAAIAGFVGLPALIVAAFVAAGVAIYAYWDEIKAGAAAAWDFIAGLFSSDALAALWSGLKNAASSAWESTKSIASAAVSALTGSIFPALKQTASTVWDGIAGAASTAWAGISAGASAVWQEVIAVVEGAVARLTGSIFPALKQTASTVWSAIADAANGAWSGISDGASAIVATIAGIFSGAASRIGEVFSSIAGVVSKIWHSATEGIATAAQAVVNAINRATQVAGDLKGAARLAAALVAPFLSAVKSINAVFNQIRAIVETGFNQVYSVVVSIGASIRAEIAGILSALRLAAAEASRLRSQAASSSAPGFSFGGLFRGAGSTVSDSNLIKISDFEYIINARSVKKFGVRFFDALNRGVLPMLRGFSSGGLVSPLAAAIPALHVDVPAFESGGLVQRPIEEKYRTPVYFQLPDGRDVQLRGPDDIGATLGQFYIKSAVRSAGRPSGAKR